MNTVDMRCQNTKCIVSKYNCPDIETRKSILAMLRMNKIKNECARIVNLFLGFMFGVARFRMNNK